MCHFPFLRRIIISGMGISLLLIICSLSVSAAPYCSISGFAPYVSYHSGSTAQTYAVASGDFNGDNRPDLAVGAFGILSVFLNDGAGVFPSRTMYPVIGATDITTGDFNNDGKLDIASVNQLTTGTVTVLLGTGTGSFGSPIVSSSGGGSPRYISPGDFNNDGKLDLAVSNTFDTAGPERNIAILLGNGMGSFTVISNNPPTNMLRAADLNSDGKTDVLAAGNPSLTLRSGNGMGGLAAPVSLNSGLPLHLTVADFNHDGKPDIAAMILIGGFEVEVLLGNGNGTFGASTIYPVGGDSSSFIEHGDVNGDGHLDLIVNKLGIPPFSFGRIFVLLGTGTGSFNQAPTYFFDMREAHRIAVADLNGDGRADVVTSNLSGGYFSVLLSTCLTPTPRYDFDGDGKSDISVFRPSSGTWYALKSTDNSLLSLHWGISTDKVVAADYDGDSKTDFAVYRAGAWYILRSTNSTLLAQSWGLSTDTPVPADYDADGRTDLAIYRSGAWYIQKSSDGSIISQFFGLSTDKPMPADYDGDGKADLAVYRPTEGLWYIQQSSNNLFLSQAFGTGGDMPLTGDFDGDGRADLAVYRPQTGAWHALSSSDNSLRSQSWGISSDTPVPADYDGDGRTDYAVYRQSERMWYILKSSDNSFLSQPFGLSTDMPIAAAYLLQ